MNGKMKPTACNGDVLAGIAEPKLKLQMEMSCFPLSSTGKKYLNICAKININAACLSYQCRPSFIQTDPVLKKKCVSNQVVV